jgi:GT2 family glycosyltransferase
MHSRSMSLSIIIPSHHRADLLQACLRSVLCHAPAQTEIIVVDDASPRGVIRQTAQNFPVNVIALKKRSGFCAAINAGLRHARAPIVQILNDDTEVQPGWTQAPCHRLQNDATLASIAPLVLRWPAGTVIDSAGDEYDAGGYAYSRGKGKLLAPTYLQPCEVFSASGCAAFYRRDALLRIGGFPEHFTAYFDDLFIGSRLRQLGYRCWYEPNSRVLHHGSASYGRIPGRRLAEQLARNDERVFWQHYRHHPRAASLLRHAGILAAKALRRWRDGTLPPFLTGRLQACCEACFSFSRSSAFAKTT